MSNAPIFTGEMAGKKLRFFTASTEGPAFPWVVEADLTKALALSRLHRRVLDAMHADDVINGVAKLIKIDGKVQTLISYTMARSLINSVEMSRLKSRGEIEKASAIYHEQTVSQLEWSFIGEAHKAMNVLTEGMSGMDSLEYFIAAEKAEKASAE